MPSSDHLQSLVVLPRPGDPNTCIDGQPPPPPIPAPAEARMTSTFGDNLLPPAAYITTPHGRAAYYAYPPLAAAPTTGTDTDTDDSMRVLLVHGVQTPALGLHPLASALRAALPTARVATFDHWGHGLSDTPVVPHAPALFHDLVDRVLAALGWPGAHLVGYSFGGTTVAGYAASGRGARVESVVLVAPAGLLRAAEFPDEVRERYLLGRGGDGDEERERGARDWVLDFLEGGELVVPADWRERVARGEVVAEAVKDWEMREHRGHLASVVALFRDGGVLDNHAAFAKTAESGVRSLVVLGELDDICSVQDLEGVGMKNVVVVPGAGHAVVRERVPEVSRHIVDFWKSL